MFRGRINTNTNPSSPGLRRTRSRSRSTTRKNSHNGMANSNMKSHDENGNMIDDQAITVFISAIDTLPADEWRARTMAFEALVESLPAQDANPLSGGITAWYKSNTTLRRLVTPLRDLLLDARSTVNKHTAQHLAYLVQRISQINPPQSDVCKYLLKDLLPTVLTLHGQTVKVIRAYTLEMMTIIIPICRFKSGLPILLEKLRKDKSRDVREACIVYLRQMIRFWSRDEVSNHLDPQKSNYLTPSICTHIGNGLARALSDQAQTVRTEARSTFELFRLKYPDLWNKIVQKKDGILSKDTRLKKSLINAAIKADNEGVSVNDLEYAHQGGSGEYGEDGSVVSGKSANSVNSWNSDRSFASRNTSRSKSSAMNRNMASSGKRNGTSSRSRGGRTNLPPSFRNPSATGAGGKVPSRSATPVSGRSNRSVPMDQPHVKKGGEEKKENDEGDINNHMVQKISHAAIPQSSIPLDEAKPKQYTDPSTSNQTIVDTLPAFQITTNTSTQANNSPKPTTENSLVATQLLAAHKSYIDELMESLRQEMNVVRDFEAILNGISENGSDGVGEECLTEEDVLRYFETVHGFLDRNTENGKKMRQAMESVSKADGS